MNARKLGPYFGLAALALLGTLALLAAPGRTPTATATQAKAPVTQAHRALAGAAPAATATATATVGATATDTPQATATATPAPQPTATATSVPVPTATATPAPSWHLLGSYSGTGAQASFATVSHYTGTQIRVDWTCTPGATAWYISFQVVNTANAGEMAGSGVHCSSDPAVGQTSASRVFTIPAHPAGADWAVSMVDTQDAGGPWTAAVYTWY